MDSSQGMNMSGTGMQFGAQPMPQPMMPGGSGPNGFMNSTPAQPGGIASQGAQVIDAPMKKDIAGLVKTIVIIVLALVSVTFIGLFIWMFVRYDEVQMDVNGQIEIAVAEAKDEQATKDEEEFLQREKYPYRVFKGPADYGELTFNYPKTWSVYVAKDANSGGDYEAYFNPIEVNVVSKDTINSLRVSIVNKGFDAVAEQYQKAMDRRDSNLTVESVTIGKDKDITANRYTGTIPDTELSGYIVIFKIRDKTAILQTDSVLFEGDYNTLLDSVQFNA